MLRDDRAAKVHVHQAGRRELGVVAGEGGRESPLVMVVAVVGRVIFAADVNDGMASGQLGRIPSADESRGGVGWELTEEIDREGLVGVEMAATIQSKDQ